MNFSTVLGCRRKIHLNAIWTKIVSLGRLMINEMQSIVSKFCGHYCIWFCMMKNRNVAMYDLVKTMTDDTGLNDYLVHRFACKLSYRFIIDCLLFL